MLAFGSVLGLRVKVRDTFMFGEGREGKWRGGEGLGLE